MTTVVGKITKEGNPFADASLQIYIDDPANNIAKWSDIIYTDANGRFQYALSMRETHQTLSKEGTVIVCAWDDETPREATHLFLGTTSTKNINEDPLLICDVDLLHKDNCNFEVTNNTITIKAKERKEYLPLFVAPNQLATYKEEVIFPQNKIIETYLKSGDEFVPPFDLFYSEEGTDSIELRAVTVGGLTVAGDLDVTIVPADIVEGVASVEVVAPDKGIAFFVIKDGGIKNGVVNGSVYYSSRFTPTRTEFFMDDIPIGETTDFSTYLFSFGLGNTNTNTTRKMKIIAHGYEQGNLSETSYTYEQDVKNFVSITGDVSVSLDAQTNKYTAALNINGNPPVQSILWQIVFRSTVIERVVKVPDADYKALINVMYQDYKAPTETEITFELLQPGSYEVEAYVINNAGVYYKMAETVFVPGGTSAPSDLVVGDSIPIGCTSHKGEIPILSVFRLSRDGYEEDAAIPMEHAFENTYFYDYVLEHEDSFYVFKAAKSVIVKKVGKPQGCAIVFNEKKEVGKEIPYTLQDFNGNVMETGLLDDSGIGVYYKVMPEGVHGVLIVGRTRKVV